jgi:RNA polymerase sigma-70 factor (ECF subfamily)
LIGKVPFGEDTDEALYRRVRQRGDMRAFEKLYGRYERRLLGFILGYLPARAEAEEVFHDALVAVLNGRELVLAPGGFAAWVHKVARNLALNRLRGGQRAALAQQHHPALPAPLTAEEALVEAQQTRALADRVATLPPGLAEVYRLRVSGLSQEEIASALDVPVGTVKSRTHELMSRLKRGLTHE